MIYIFTEDSRDGKELIESVVKILYPDYDIKVEPAYWATTSLEIDTLPNSLFNIPSYLASILRLVF